MEFKKEELIKSPLNYVGGKFKLLPQILPLFPNNIDTFIDLFGGGFNVGINIKANKIIYNDLCWQVKDLLENFYENSYEYIHKSILKIIDEYNLSRSDLYGYEKYNCNSSDGLGKYNKEKYLKLRQDYNNNPDFLKFYTLITCSFNNQISFNSKNEFNMPYGKRDYNKSLQNKLKSFVNELHNKNIYFFSKDFRELKINNLLQNDFVYVDTPYYNSTASYNENNGWTEQDEKDLLHLLDQLNNKNIKFALSNNFKYDNSILKNWSKKYNIHYLNYNYGNCNYQKKNKNKDIEVLITNY